jgi:hypothetical protein
VIPSSLLGELATECTTCEFTQITVGPDNRTDAQTQSQPVRLELTSPAGELVAFLSIPSDLSDQLNTTLTITFVSNVPDSFSNQEIGGTILDITLADVDGNSVTELDAPLVICFARPNKTSPFKNRDVCLSYYDTRKAKWVCEDECLSYTGKDDQLCGETDHLTNFALLLTGAAGGNGNGDPCSSFSQDNTLAWVSLGLVAGAILIVALSVIVVEVRTRWNNHRLDSQISQRISAGSA